MGRVICVWKGCPIPLVCHLALRQPPFPSRIQTDRGNPRGFVELHKLGPLVEKQGALIVIEGFGNRLWSLHCELGYG